MSYKLQELEQHISRNLMNEFNTLPDIRKCISSHMSTYFQLDLRTIVSRRNSTRQFSSWTVCVPTSMKSWEKVATSFSTFLIRKQKDYVAPLFDFIFMLRILRNVCYKWYNQSKLILAILYFLKKKIPQLQKTQNLKK